MTLKKFRECYQKIKFLFLLKIDTKKNIKNISRDTKTNIKESKKMINAL